MLLRSFIIVYHRLFPKIPNAKILKLSYEHLFDSFLMVKIQPSNGVPAKRILKLLLIDEPVVKILK